MLQALFVKTHFPAGFSAAARCLRFAGHKQLHVDPADLCPGSCTRLGSQRRANNVRFAEGAANKPLPEARCAMGRYVLLAAGSVVAQPFRLPEARCEAEGVHFGQSVTAQVRPPRPGAQKRCVFNDSSQGKNPVPWAKGATGNDVPATSLRKPGA